MFAIIQDGGNQYRVEEGQTLEVQLHDLPENAKAITFDRVLLVGGLDGAAKIGRPIVAGASVSASIIDEVKGDKIVVRKHRRRKGYMLKQGHRQRYLHVRIDKITA